MVNDANGKNGYYNTSKAGSEEYIELIVIPFMESNRTYKT